MVAVNDSVRTRLLVAAAGTTNNLYYCVIVLLLYYLVYPTNIINRPTLS